MYKQRFPSALKAFGWHLLGSVLVACVAASLVFGLLYPPPYAQMLGGFELFLLVVGVDVVSGPLLTLVLFNPVKSKLELFLDLGIVACLQMAALVYGLNTVWTARPVFFAYDVDRFRVVTLADIEPTDVLKIPPSIGAPGWAGPPRAIGIRVAQADEGDYLEQLQLSLNGQEVAFRTDRWRSYTEFRTQVLERSHAMAGLLAKRPEASELINAVVAKTGRSAQDLRWLPVQSRKGTGWTVLLDADTAKIAGFVPVDGF
jgi:hypothetical protein